MYVLETTTLSDNCTLASHAAWRIFAFGPHSTLQAGDALSQLFTGTLWRHLPNVQHAAQPDEPLETDGEAIPLRW